MQNDLNLIWIQCSDKCYLPHLIPVDTSRHQWMCVTTNFKGFVQNVLAFHSAALCHKRPVYIQIQMRGHFKNIVEFFLKSQSIFISFPFHFVLRKKESENSSKTTSRKMANACTLQRKHKPYFQLPKNSVPRLHKVQYRNWHYGSERSWSLQMCPWKPRTGHIADLKTNKLQNMSWNIHNQIWGEIFMCRKLRRTKYTFFFS